MDDLTGKQLGAYQIAAPLGVGGMATVYRAYQPKMERYVALKVLGRHFSGDPEFVSRFSQEARLIAQLEHPNILPIYDFGESDGYTYMAMRLVKGGSLADKLLKHGKLELTQINRIITQVGGALDYAHEKKVIHRDLKPGNVLIDEFGSCLLTDFGIAKIIETTSHLTHTGGILGTPFYISPEQGSGKQIDNRSDIYALGVVLYHMTVGDVPYKADTPMAVVFKHVHDPLPFPRQQAPDLPEPIEQIILKALAKSPNDRYSTANQLVNAFQSAMEQITFDMDKTQGPIPEVDQTQIYDKIPTDQDILAAKPSDKPLPAISEIQESDDKKSSDAINVKVSTGRRWIYVFLTTILLAGLAGAVWRYYNFIRSEPILKVDAIPAGAAVYIDDEYVGIASVQIDELPPGAHKVRISKKGYIDYEKNIFIEIGSPQYIRAKLTSRPYGRLELKSAPPGAQVSIDNTIRGNTPIIIENLPAGNQKVVINKKGYEKKTLQVSIQAGDYKIMDVQLKPVVKPLPYGRLELKSSPEGAQVSIDNTIRGNTPIIIENLPAGNQKVIINKKGYEKKTLQVSIKAGEYKTLDVQLKPVVKPGPKKKISNDIGMEFVYIQPGTFKMGSPSAEQGRYKDEHQHRVTLTRGYYIQTTEVTQHQWEAVMGNNPSSFKNACGKDCPVERVSWHDAQAFIRKLNQMEGTTQYRLPTEAQWEYACRAGSTSRFSFGNSDGLLDFFGWYKTNSVMTHAVGQKPANPWGL
ncbi:MAG: PEGA domain-containing protein, partial [Desulfobacteraceae bacterium]